MRRNEINEFDEFDKFDESIIEQDMEYEPVKRKKKKKRRKKRYLLKFLIFVILCVGIYFFLSSSFFDIQKLDVSNNSYYTSEQVIAISKVKVGTNIFAMSAKDVRKRMVKDPYIKNVKIKRNLPSSVSFDVLERKEFASIPYGDKFILIDKEGMVLRLSKVDPKVTQLLGMTLKSAEPGKPLEVEENAVFSDTLDLLVAVSKSQLYFKKVDISNVVIKAYIYDYLICEGTPKNIKNNLSGVQGVLQVQYDAGIQRGVLKVGSGEMIPFSPLIE